MQPVTRMSKEEMIAILENNKDTFTGLVEYLKENSLGLYCNYMGYNNFRINTSKTGRLNDLTLDDEAMADIKGYIEELVYNLHFVVIRDGAGIDDLHAHTSEIYFTYGFGLSYFGQGILYSDNELEDTDKAYGLSTSHIGENWYYYEVRH